MQGVEQLRREGRRQEPQAGDTDGRDHHGQQQSDEVLVRGVEEASHQGQGDDEDKAPHLAGRLPPRNRGAPPSRPAVPDDTPAPIDQARVERRRQAAATEAAALRRARQKRAARELGTTADLPLPISLRDTA
ncbi:hypothetical protein [Streptomyces sp. 135]|uniref:hypothetical protein n=1 Tax=Streptomyces sp. 135 TaxID=2838850 RepID=UPI001CBD327A|nr:hypothetical protein [Streptomyces sp. 135]